MVNVRSKKKMPQTLVNGVLGGIFLLESLIESRETIAECPSRRNYPEVGVLDKLEMRANGAMIAGAVSFEPQQVRIVIADDKPLIRHGPKRLFRYTSRFQGCR